jgi:hypothetical protein
MEIRERSRPRNFSVVVGIVFIFGLLGFVYYHPRSPLWLTGALIGMILTPVLFWFGLNFARIVILIAAIADVLLFAMRLPQFPHFAFLGQLALVIRLSVAIFFLWWLNTIEVRSYFRPTSREQPSKSI